MMKSTKDAASSSSRLRIWILSVFYNIGLQVLLRVVTFVANAFILRLLTRDVLGLVNVRILLFYTSVQFLSREAFRRTCFSSFKQDAQKLEDSFVNLSYLSVPLSLIFGSGLWFVWSRALSLPTGDLNDQYQHALPLMFVGVIIELLAESLYVYGQRHDYIKLKVVIEGIFQFVRVAGFTFAAILSPENAVLGFAFSQVAASLIYSLSYLFYFTLIDKKPLKLFLPTLNKQTLENTCFLLGTSFQFLMNTIVKQVLTEGERYMMTIFTLVSLAEQGVYDVINNLASLPARLIFQQIEENSYRLFSGLVKRDVDYAKQRTGTDRALNILVILSRFMLIVGLLIFVYGFSFSEFALFLYGGNSLLGGSLGWMSVALMRWQCVYIVLIALNGILEAFTFAAMTNTMMQTFSMTMVGLSICFLGISIYAVTVWGVIGFVLGNCFNMFTRILYSLVIIAKISGKSFTQIVRDIIPSKLVLISFAVVFVGLHQLNGRLTSGRLFDAQMLSNIVAFVGTGAVVFVLHLAVIYKLEAERFAFVKEQFLTRKNQ